MPRVRRLDALKVAVLRAIDRSTLTETLFNRWSLIRTFRKTFGYSPSLDAPRTFNEKLLKKLLTDHRALLTIAADKIASRDYVAARVGREVLPTVYATFARGADIPWDDLPSRFVLKANHGSGMLKIVQDKTTVDRAAVTRAADSWLRTNYYTRTREWAYKNIPPVLFAEEFLGTDTVPEDFKFFVFGGRAKYLQVDIDRFTGPTSHKRNLYDRHGSLLDATYIYPMDRSFVLPAGVDRMWDIAEAMGRDFDFIRVDLYLVDGAVKFGELTNYPDAGKGLFTPRELDRILGDCWT
jgi:hypothetical protein